MNKVRVRTAEQPLRRLLVPAAVLSLSAAFVVGAAGVARAQDASIDGTWTVEASSGDFDPETDSFAGFRVNEVLDPGGATTAVGRTPDVSGRLDVTGTVIDSFEIVVDLTTLATDNNFRNGAIQRTLSTGDFPTASFVSTEPVDLGAIAPEGEVFQVSVPGTLTIKDVSRDVTVDLDAAWVGDRAVVTSSDGGWPIAFGDFEVTMPSAPIVVSVEDNGLLEWQLFFSRGDAMSEEVADDATADDEAADDEATDE